MTRLMNTNPAASPACPLPQTVHYERPDTFVCLTEMIDGLLTDLKYAGADNFIGHPLPGYEHNQALLTRPAALALQAVQNQLRPLGLGVKVFDAYRPQRTVNFFLQWAQDLSDTRMKDIYYPGMDKSELLSGGYLNSPSGHSRGSTVDLTLIRLSDHSELDMGTRFDFFGPQSWTSFSSLLPLQRSNREFLQKIMHSHGFTGIREEWWHFTLNNEPYTEDYFDFIPS